MLLRTRAFAFCIVILGLASYAQADVIVAYTPADSLLNPVLTASSSNSNVTAAVMTTGGGLTPYNNGTWRWRAWDPASTSFADAQLAGDTWTWGYTVANDVQIKLDTLQLRVDRNLNGPDDLEIQMSVNGGTATTVFTHDFAGSGAPQTFNIDLSPFSKYQGLGDVVTFTFAGFNSVSALGSLEMQSFGTGEGLILNGTVSVPEPATMGVLAGLAGFAIYGRRRMKRKQKEAKADLAA